MKRIFLFLLFPPLMLNSQNSNGFFNISKEQYYYGIMTQWKDNLYDDEDSKFETTIDNDSIFSFGVKDNVYGFEERYQLNLDRNKKIKKIEYFFYAQDGDLEEWFPYKYPVKINKIFKELGDPDVINGKLPYYPINAIKGAEYTFQKYYKWNNASYRDTKVFLEIAILKVEKPVTNIRGKIKKYQTEYCGYISNTAKSSGNITDKDINFNIASQIAKGQQKSWKNDRNELISLLGEKVFYISDFGDDDSMAPYVFYIKDSNNPRAYRNRFFYLANGLYDIDFSEHSLKNQKYTYTSLPDGIIAKAVGMNKNCCVEILIDIENWNASTYLDKLFIMFHELGHDYFNLTHSDGIRLMATNKMSFDDPSIFGEMVHEMMIAILKKQKGGRTNRLTIQSSELRIDLTYLVNKALKDQSTADVKKFSRISNNNFEFHSEMKIPGEVSKEQTNKLNDKIIYHYMSKFIQTNDDKNSFLDCNFDYLLFRTEVSDKHDSKTFNEMKISMKNLEALKIPFSEKDIIDILE